jgi:hypothetical protein
MTGCQGGALAGRRQGQVQSGVPIGRQERASGDAACGVRASAASYWLKVRLGWEDGLRFSIHRDVGTPILSGTRVAVCGKKEGRERGMRRAGMQAEGRSLTISIAYPLLASFMLVARERILAALRCTHQRARRCRIQFGGSKLRD